MNECNLLKGGDLVTVLGMASLVSHSFEMGAYSAFTFLYKENNQKTSESELQPTSEGSSNNYGLIFQ